MIPKSGKIGLDASASETRPTKGVIMARLRFPQPFMHGHPPIKNVNDVVSEQLTVGQRTADWVVARVGSWGFIIGQSALLGLWAVLDMTTWVMHWDTYPFILMNLVLSLQAAYTSSDDNDEPKPAGVAGSFGST